MPSTDKRYFAIGFFVLLGFALLVGGALFFGGGSLFQKKVYFETYFDTSVQGMDVGSPVKLRGVKIGSVEAIDFVRHLYGDTLDEVALSHPQTQAALHYVRVLCSIDATRHPGFDEDGLDAIIKRGLIARQGSQGITGIVFVDLDILAPDALKEQKMLYVPWKPDAVYVPSVPNTLQNFVDILEKIANNLENVDFAKMSDSLTHLATTIDNTVTEAGIPALMANLSALVEQITAQTTTLASLLSSLDGKAIASNVTTIVEQLAGITTELNAAIPQLSGSADSALVHATKVFEALDNLTRQLTVLTTDIQTHGALRDVEDTLESFSRISAQLEVLVEEIRERPSRLIFDDDEE